MGRIVTLAFLGDSGCGKDESCLHLAAATPLRFGKSMSWHLAEFVAPRVGVSVETLRSPERHKYAEQMFCVGEELRDADPGVLVRPALACGELLNGLRDPREVEYARQHVLVDLFVWIDRDVPEDPTMRRFREKYGDKPHRACDVRIDNNGTLEELYARLASLVRALGVDYTTPQRTTNP